MASVRRDDTLEPLRAAYSDGLQQLLTVSLQMIALTLAAELSQPTRPGRANELAMYVDQWCDLEATANEAMEQCAVDECTPFERLLTEVGELAGSLALPNATTVVEGPVRWAARHLTYAWGSFTSALTFVARGMNILFRDLREMGEVLLLVLQGNKPTPNGMALIRRTLVDVVMLVPYSVIMVIPLSPPGHVFAFSLLNKCFPRAIPSPFTSQRQDIFEIYKSIASDAEEDAKVKSSTVATTRLTARAIKLSRSIVTFLEPLVALLRATPALIARSSTKLASATRRLPSANATATSTSTEAPGLESPGASPGVHARVGSSGSSASLRGSSREKAVVAASKKAGAVVNLQGAGTGEQGTGLQSQDAGEQGAEEQGAAGQADAPAPGMLRRALSLGQRGVSRLRPKGGSQPDASS
mmetsp:Transcript_48994/g.97759  ORF Transcript_48994/g.97759 Transcript_48994/m.97759 type:complete len:413 (-) Transcript_48994:266-1504(-)